jgi:hypothetical protein
LPRTAASTHSESEDEGAPPPVVDAGAGVVGQAGDIGPRGVLAVAALAAAALAATLGVGVHCAALKASVTGHYAHL